MTGAGDGPVIVGHRTLPTVPLNTDRLKLYWNRLTYKTSDRNSLITKTLTKNTKTIINDLNGEVTSGQLTGILGPSGSGKTTLIECLAGRRLAGLSGRVWVKNTAQKKIKLRIAYNGQTDALIDELTVREALRYASELKQKRTKRYDFFDSNHQNYRLVSGNDSLQQTGDTTNNNDLEVDQQIVPDANSKVKMSHTLNVRNMLEVFGLIGCSRVKTGAISGGQKKRLSIALELIFSPNILLLDEPTTGLDSVSSYQCLSLLKTLSYNREPLVIAASIHQPTARLLSFFDNIYVLSLDGQCVYSGPTNRLINHLSGFGFNCPVYHNPSDYVMEISSGAHGPQAIETLVAYERHNTGGRLESMSIAANESIVGPKKGRKRGDPYRRTTWEQLTDTWVLMKRAHITSLRNPLVIWLRIIGLTISLATKMVVYSQTQAGLSNGGCTDTQSMFAKLRTIAVRESSFHKSFKNIQNVSYILTTTMFIHFVTIAPTLMTFPIELNTFVKEHFNKWYTCWSYFTARSLVDIPVVVIIPIIYASLLWWMTDQIWDVWRFSVHLLVMVLLALVSHSFGLLLSAIFINNIRASLLSFTIFITPLLLFSGALIPIRTLPSYLQTFSYLSIFRLSYESMLIILYGFNRCPTGGIYPMTFSELSREFGVNMNNINECMAESDALANVTHNGLRAINRLIDRQNPSKMLEWFALKDSDLYTYLSLLCIYTVVLRCMAYYALKWRARIK